MSETSIQLGDQVEMRKPHPCGSYVWTVYRLGGDIGLVCGGCGRRIMLPRSVLMKRMKKITHVGPSADPAVTESRSENEWSSE
ncbi:MAG: DUF951 domain-containing protein [Anaerolineae bacterium]|nr:DUF951 domain-containing protein [Anaerolineae bacterium]